MKQHRLWIAFFLAVFGFGPAAWHNQASAQVTVSIEKDNYQVQETGKTLDIKIRAAGSSMVTASVRVTTSQVTATSGTDYAPLDTVVSFIPGGATEKTVTITIYDDKIYEGSAPETFTVALSAPDNCTIGSPSSASVSILEDDLPLSIIPVTVKGTGGTFSPDPAPINTTALDQQRGSLLLAR